jgi:molecular chaperone HtpG
LLFFLFNIFDFRQVFFISKHDDDQYIWENESDKNSEIRKDESIDNFIRGTTVTLYLKEDLGEFLEEKKIKDLIKKHSEFFDIKLIHTVKKE